MEKKKKKTIRYKLFSANSDYFPYTLQEKLEELIMCNDSSYRRVFSRKELLFKDNNEFRLINKIKRINGALFCQLVKFESDSSQMTISVVDDMEQLEVDHLSLEEKNEFISGAVYFIVFGNHVVYVSIGNLTARGLEKHLSWILNNGRSNQDYTINITLNDKPPQNIISELEKAPVKSIIIGSNITNVDLDINDKDEGLLNKFNRLIKTELNFDGVLDNSNANLNFSVNINCPRFNPIDSQKVIDMIATSMRNANENDVKIILRDGSQIMGNNFKLSSKLPIYFYSNGKLDENKLMLEMINWLSEKIESENLTDLVDHLVTN